MVCASIDELTSHDDGSVHHLKALLSFLLASEALDSSWKPVLLPLVTDAAVLLGHTAWRSAQPAAPAPSTSAAPPPLEAEAKKHDWKEALLPADDQPWLKTEPHGLRAMRLAHAGWGGRGKPGPATVVTADELAGGGDEGSQGWGRDDKQGIAPVMDLDKYFKVKTLDGGKPGGSFCIRGVVFSNQVIFSEHMMRVRVFLLYFSVIFSERVMRVRVHLCFDVTDSAARLFTRRWLAGSRPPAAIGG